MIEWTKASEELPKEDGQYIVWVSRLMVAWYNSAKKMWELSPRLKVRAEGNTVTHWTKVDEPKKEVEI